MHLLYCVWAFFFSELGEHFPQVDPDPDQVQDPAPGHPDPGREDAASPGQEVGASPGRGAAVSLDPDPGRHTHTVAQIPASRAVGEVTPKHLLILESFLRQTQCCRM